MRRRPGILLPIELDILEAGIAALGDGDGEFHGFAIAKAIQDREGAQRLTAHGTLYKALGRLADGGLLASRWEDADEATAEGRPRRRLYRVTAEGARAFHAAPARSETSAPRLGWSAP